MRLTIRAMALLAMPLFMTPAFAQADLDFMNEPGGDFSTVPDEGPARSEESRRSERPEPEPSGRSEYGEWLQQSADDLATAYAAGETGGRWSLSVSVYRTSPAVQDTVVIQDIDSERRCMAHGMLQAAQMMGMRGQPKQREDPYGHTHPFEYSEATLLCVDMTTGRAVTDHFWKFW